MGLIFSDKYKLKTKDITSKRHVKKRAYGEEIGKYKANKKVAKKIARLEEDVAELCGENGGTWNSASAVCLKNNKPIELGYLQNQLRNLKQMQDI